MPIQSTLEWRNTEQGLTPILLTGRTETSVAWAAQRGSQVAALSCPVFEVLIEGNRGPGKTDTLLMCFAQHCGKGYGAEWRGIIFRRTYKELKDLISKSLKWIPKIWPKARYNASEHVWTWPDGEQMLLSYFRVPKDYDTYHGHAYPFIGWEELTRWPDDKCYKPMFSCCRSSDPRVPKMIRSTTNPYGVGHNWVKARFRLPIGGTRGPVIRDSVDRDGEPEPERVVIHCDLAENKILLAAQPNYLQSIKAAARNQAEYDAWVHGSWDIVAGGMFDDVWEPKIHIVPNFPPRMIPNGWYVDRSYDHGQSAPFSVGWWAESNGEPLHYNGYTYGRVRGDMIRFAEWYGWNGTENEGLNMLARDIARGIKEREADMGIAGRVFAGPADNNIFDPDPSGTQSTASEMEAEGVSWTRCDKSPGSRKQGWEQMRKMMKSAKEYPREHPAVYITERCAQFKRTVPVLPRSDLDLDDVAKEAEDHIGDETRYRLRYKRKVITTGEF
jgi:hypothetical protein